MEESIMKATKTELVFILDRSGSMCGLEADTIGGYNSMLAKQKALPDSANVTTVLFDDRCELLHDKADIQTVAPITNKEYYARGCTALLDAMGMAIQKMVTDQKFAPPQNRADKVMFVITTDGMENASREYTFETVRSLVEQQKKKGWEFLFLGANIDAISTAGRFGIGADRAVNYHADSEGTALNYEVVSDTISMMRASSTPIKSNWKARIERDFKHRVRK